MRSAKAGLAIVAELRVFDGYPRKSQRGAIKDSAPATVKRYGASDDSRLI
jgi:hypothetical protein